MCVIQSRVMLKADRRSFSDVDEDLIRDPSTSFWSLHTSRYHLATITWSRLPKNVSTKDVSECGSIYY